MSSSLPTPQLPRTVSAWPVVLDLLCLTALLATASVPLIMMRGSPRLHENTFLAFILSPGVVVCLAWFGLRRRFAAPNPAPENVVERLPWPRFLVVVMLLLVLTIVCFSLPLRKHFWGGADEVGNFAPGLAAVWSDAWDMGIGRPLLGLSGAVGLALTPNSIEGSLWLASALCFGNGVVLWGVMRRLIPQAEWAGVAAAVLLICHRDDGGRFMVMWASNAYCLSLFLLLFAFWLFLVSYDHRRRWMLVLACCFLGAALLSNEAGYPLAVLGPLCLWLSRKRDRDVGVWSFAWLGVMTLTAGRFLLYLTSLGHSSYQAHQASATLHRPDLLAANLVILLKPIFFYVKPWDRPGKFLFLAVVAGAAAALACILCRIGGGPSRRRLLVGLGVAALGSFLGVAPFLHMGTWFRTQFYAAPAEAAGIALALALGCSVFGRRIGPTLLAAVVALLAAHSAVQSQVSQDHARGPVCFEKTVHIFQQIHALSPTLPDDVLVLLVGDEGAESPIGVAYHVSQLSRVVFQRLTLQVGCVQSGESGADFADQTPRPQVLQAATIKSAESGVSFTADAVLARTEGVALATHFPYDRVIAFHVDADGGLSLLRRLPTSLAPPSEATQRYDPVALLRPGPWTELPFLRYSAWMRPPCDVVSAADGLVFGEGWGPLRFADGRLSRVARQETEIVVNPMGASTRDIRLRLQSPSKSDGSCQLTFVNETGQAAAVASVEESGEVRATLKLDPTRVAVFRLRLEVGNLPCKSFRVFAPGGPWPANPNPPSAHSAPTLAKK